MKKQQPYRYGANLELARAMQEIRRSNATSPKPVRVERKRRSRSGDRRAAIREAS